MIKEAPRLDLNFLLARLFHQLDLSDQSPPEELLTLLVEEGNVESVIQAVVRDVGPPDSAYALYV